MGYMFTGLSSVRQMGLVFGYSNLSSRSGNTTTLERPTAFWFESCDSEYGKLGQIEVWHGNLLNTHRNGSFSE